MLLDKKKTFQKRKKSKKTKMNNHKLLKVVMKKKVKRVSKVASLKNQEKRNLRRRALLVLKELRITRSSDLLEIGRRVTGSNQNHQLTLLHLSFQITSIQLGKSWSMRLKIIVTGLQMLNLEHENKLHLMT